MNITFCAITPGRFKCAARGCGADALVRVNVSNCCGEHATERLRAEYIAAVDTLAGIIAEAEKHFPLCCLFHETGGSPSYSCGGDAYGAAAIQVGRARVAVDDLPRGGP